MLSNSNSAKRKKSFFVRTFILFLTILFISFCAAPAAETTSSGGSDTVMGCSPPTGCYPPYSWYGGGYCYATSNDCHNGGNSKCRQCY